MTPKQKYLLTRKCWRKKGRWQTMKAARHRAREIFKKGGQKLYPYRCTGCGEVHLTKDITGKGQII